METAARNQVNSLIPIHSLWKLEVTWSSLPPNRSFVRVDTIVGFYLSVTATFFHAAIFIFAANVILGTFISLYFYVDAACFDLRYLFDQMHAIPTELVGKSKTQNERIEKTNRRKLFFIDAVSLHHDITK